MTKPSIYLQTAQKGSLLVVAEDRNDTPVTFCLLKAVRDVIFLLTATQPSAGSGKEIPEGGGERARGEVAGFRNSESGALS